MSDFSLMETVRLALAWAKSNDIGPLQTVSMASGVAVLFLFSRFVRGAKKVVTDVHHVYEQALVDEKRASARLREQLEHEREANRALFDELAAERETKNDLLRTLSRIRAKAAAKGE